MQFALFVDGKEVGCFETEEEADAMAARFFYDEARTLKIENLSFQQPGAPKWKTKIWLAPAGQWMKGDGGSSLFIH